MKQYILMGVGVLLFCCSHAQSIDNGVTEREDIPASSNPTLTSSGNSSVERFSLPKEGSISEAHNDKRLYEGSVKNKKLHGNWTSWYQNGLICDSGKFVHGLPDGEWKHWDSEGKLVAVRTYNADKYQRINLEMYRYNPRHPSYPLSVLYHKNKNAAMQYLHSSYSFPHTVKRIDDLSLQQWVIANITPGNIYHPVYDQSLHHGLYLNYFSNGEVKDSGYYNNGLRHGIWIEKDNPSGIIRQGNYVNGKKTREWKSYNKSGQLVEIVYYNNKGGVTRKKRFR